MSFLLVRVFSGRGQEVTVRKKMRGAVSSSFAPF
jgi:hypothetical protein